MKTIIVILFISIGLHGHAQSNTGITVSSNPFYQIQIQQTPTLDFKRAFSKKAPASFSVYNATTGFNDSYTGYRNSFSYSRSTVVTNNQFRGVKIDSFNPYGATDFKSAVLIGVLNSIFR